MSNRLNDFRLNSAIVCLLKYTNVMKGYQMRWFVLDSAKHSLSYFEKEETIYSGGPARGTYNLLNCQISPSDEDDVTFLIQLSSGEVVRLRAQDTKERQVWIDRLRLAACTSPLLHSKTTSASSTAIASPNKSPFRRASAAAVVVSETSSPAGGRRRTARRSRNVSHLNSSGKLPAHLRDVDESFLNLRELLANMNDRIRSLPPSVKSSAETVGRSGSAGGGTGGSGAGANSLEKDLLLLKATSMATKNCLERCMNILKTSSPRLGSSSRSSSNTRGNISLNRAGTGATDNIATDEGAASDIPLEEGIDALLSESYGAAGDVASPARSSVSEPEPIQHANINHEDDVEREVVDEEDLGSVEEHKSLILHLLEQLKLGTDLTKVTLPTFILERRSLLEMFADFMVHPQLFIAIARQPDSESRMLALTKWFLTSFHGSRKAGLAKKPYNPIIGEHFACSWSFTDDKSTYLIRFIGEQVSHHPPISAFHFECAELGLSLTGSFHTKSKFLGLSLAVQFIGCCQLDVRGSDGSIVESYSIQLPNCYARSILTQPWTELGDRATIASSAGLYCSVTFHSRPFYGGKAHRISGEVRRGVFPPGATGPSSNSSDSLASIGRADSSPAQSPRRQRTTQDLLCRFQGEWNGLISIQYPSQNTTEELDTRTLPVTVKRVRPLEQQGPFESQRLWQKVSEAVAKGDIATATRFKSQLEDAQRRAEKYRASHGTAFQPHFFRRSPESTASASQPNAPSPSWLFIGCQALHT